MKKKGSVIEFSHARDRELYASFTALLESGRGESLRELFALAARQPCSRFWVSELRARDVVSCMLRGVNGEAMESMHPGKRAMYEEIFRRVKARLDEQAAGGAETAGSTLLETVTEVVNGGAPEFYLSDESARLLIYRHRARLRSARVLGAARQRGRLRKES